MPRRRVAAVQLPPEVQVVRSKGRLYYYWAPGRNTARAGERHKLPRDPQSSEFWREIERLGGSNPNVPAGSVADVVGRYRSGEDFLSLAESTKKTYGVHLDRFENPDAWGLFPAKGLTPVAVQTARDAMKDTPVMANQMLAVGRTVWDWAIPLGLVTLNPFEKIKDLRIPDRGHVPWPEWARAYVMESAPSDIARFVRLGLMTGQRESDIVRFGPVHRERNGLWCRPQKTNRVRKAFFIPLSTAEAIELDRWGETPIGFTSTRWKAPIERHREDVYLYTPRGQVYTPERIRSRWGRWLEQTAEGKTLCKRWRTWLADQVKRYGWEIDPEDSRGPTLHGLRGAAVMERRRQGYEAQAISNDIGMSLPMVMRYTRFMDQMEAAEMNRRRFEVINS
ncbi:hypothetical protein ACD578_05205 [Microvirga sp. RSM25]|uniref:hypothetical protein n=1 Tax=Microvirga sp. RSM25 TaxID=3273802 RepID=UPI00384FFDD9